MASARARWRVGEGRKIETDCSVFCFFPPPLEAPPQGQEVGALEADDFLRDSHASGLC